MTTMIAQNPLSREDADALASRLANRTHQTWYTLYDTGRYHVADDDDMSVYWPDAAVIEEFRPDIIGAIPDEPPPDDAPGSDDENGTPHEALDVCPSCGDQLPWEGPSLCAACQEASETLTATRYCPFCLEAHDPQKCRRILSMVGATHIRERWCDRDGVPLSAGVDYSLIAA